MISESRTTSALRSSGSPTASLPAACRRPRLPSLMAACPPRAPLVVDALLRGLAVLLAAPHAAYRKRRRRRGRHTGLGEAPDGTVVSASATARSPMCAPRPGGFKRHIDIKDGSEFSLEGGQWPPDPRQPSGQRRDEQQLACMHLRGTQPVDELDPCHGVALTVV